MRLIDADALRADYFVTSTTTNTPLYRYVSMEQIANAPTVEPASPWHRVEDELPPPNKTVLVCNIWRDVNGEPHKVITMDSFTISPRDSVIAWMPLPEPPKEGNK